MRSLATLTLASFIALSVPVEASAQTSRSMGATRVTVTVPERRSAAASSSTLAAWGGDQGGGTTVRRTLQGAGIGALECRATIDLPGIGRLSVFCLETADAYGRSAGVAFELSPEQQSGRVAIAPGAIELHLADGAVVRLYPRAFADGSGALYASMPTAAFERIAASPLSSVSHAGRTHSLSSDEARALRAVAAAIGN